VTVTDGSTCVDEVRDAMREVTTTVVKTPTDHGINRAKLRAEEPCLRSLREQP
jgi:hypothetical protein